MQHEFRTSRYLIAQSRAVGPLIFLGLAGAGAVGNFLQVVYGPMYYPSMAYWLFAGVMYAPLGYAGYRSAIGERVMLSDSGMTWKRILVKERVLPWASIKGVRASRTRSGKIIALQITGFGVAPMRLRELDDPQRFLEIARDQTGLEPEYVNRIDWNSRGMLVITMIVGCLYWPAIFFANMYLALH